MQPSGVSLHRYTSKNVHKILHKDHKVTTFHLIHVHFLTFYNDKNSSTCRSLITKLQQNEPLCKLDLQSTDILLTTFENRLKTFLFDADCWHVIVHLKLQQCDIIIVSMAECIFTAASKRQKDWTIHRSLYKFCDKIILQSIRCNSTCKYTKMFAYSTAVQGNNIRVMYVYSNKHVCHLFQ